jgi:hypothetical protein
MASRWWSTPGSKRRKTGEPALGIVGHDADERMPPHVIDRKLGVGATFLRLTGHEILDLATVERPRRTR